MKLTLKYDPFIEDITVQGIKTNFMGKELITDTPIKDFYVTARKKSGINISALTRKCGLSHPTLANIENSHNSNALKPMLIALLELGYTIELQEPTP